MDDTVQVGPARQPASATVGVYVVTSARLWVEAARRLRMRNGLVVWDDPADPDEPIRAVYLLPHHGGIVVVVTDEYLYLVEADLLASSSMADSALGAEGRPAC